MVSGEALASLIPVKPANLCQCGKGMLNDDSDLPYVQDITFIILFKRHDHFLPEILLTWNIKKI